METAGGGVATLICVGGVAGMVGRMRVGTGVIVAGAVTVVCRVAATRVPIASTVWAAMVYIALASGVGVVFELSL